MCQRIIHNLLFSYYKITLKTQGLKYITLDFYRNKSPIEKKEIKVQSKLKPQNKKAK